MRAVIASVLCLAATGVLSAAEYEQNVFRSIQSLEQLELQNQPDAATELSLAAGFLLLKQDELSRAAIETALSIDPNSSRGHYLKGRLLLDARGDVQAALGEFRKSAELDAGNSKARYYSGVCLRHLGQLELARTAFRKAAAQESSSWPLRGEAQTELALGEVREALVPALRALQLEPKSPENLLITGRVYSKLNQAGKAIPLLAEATSLEPYWDLPHLYLGRLYLERAETRAKGKDELAIFNRLREADIPKARRDTPEADHPKSEPQAKTRKELDQFGHMILAVSPMDTVREGEKFLALFPDSEFQEKTLELEFQAFQQRGDYSAARRIASRILALNRWDATVLASLANLIANQNDAPNFEAAEEYAKRAAQSAEATESPAGMESPEFIRWKYDVLSSAYSAEGILALRRSDPGTAIAKLRSAIELRPKASGVDYLRLGEALRLAKDSNGAKKAFARAELLGPPPVTESAKRLDAALADNPANVALSHFEAARKLEKADDLTHAVQEYEQVAQSAPNFAEAFHNLGLAYYRLQNYQKSKEFLKRASQLKPELAGGELFLGLTEFRLGNFTESERHLTEALRAEPDSREAYLALLGDQTALGRFSSATANSAQRLFPKDAEMSNAIGLACLERIREIARQANDSGPQSPSFLWLSLRRAEEKQDSQATAKWVAKAKGFEEPPAIREFDSVSLMLKKAFDTILINSPDSAPAHTVKGYLHESRGETDAALFEYRAAGDHFAAGRLLAQNVQLSDAEIEFRKAVEGDPENFRASADLGRLYLQENAAGKALPLLLALVQRYPGDADAWSDLGKAQSAAGDCESAVRSYKRALANDSSLNRVHYQLAMLYRKLGQEDLARGELQRFRDASKTQ